MSNTALPLRPLLFSSAAVFLVVFTLWMLVLRNATVLNTPAMAPGLSAALSATWVTAQYVAAILYVRWLVRAPDRQRTAAFVAGGLLVVALVSALIQLLSAPSLITSPLIPDSIVTFARFQIGVRTLPVVLGLCFVLPYLFKKQWLHAVKAALATYFLFILWDIIWILVPEEVQNFGMF